MPNSNVELRSPSASGGSAKLERKLRLSLPEKEKAARTTAAPGSRRNTISEESLPKVRKKSKAPITPTIPEDEDEVIERRLPEVVVVNETRSGNLNRSSSATSKRSVVSGKSTTSTFTYDNGAFEGNLRATTEPRLASRTPSLRSLEVYREQYCCCAKRTKCERYLLVTVTILSIIVIVLVIVIAILGKNGNFDSLAALNVNL